MGKAESLINNSRVLLATAVPSSVWKQIGRKGNTFEGEIISDEGVVSAYVKLLGPEDVLKEALCAVLAKRLSLPITQPYYVEVRNNEQFFGGKKLSTPAFGLGRPSIPSFKIQSDAVAEILNKWPELLKCAVFDLWIANSDRYPSTNLTFERNGTIWIFDHDDALASHLSPSTAVTSQLLGYATEDKGQMDLYRLRRDGWLIAEEIADLDWKEIRKDVQPNTVEGGSQFFDRYSKFLQARVSHLQKLIHEGLGLRQFELFPLPLAKDSRNEK